jgi:hypothetical protein
LDVERALEKSSVLTYRSRIFVLVVVLLLVFSNFEDEHAKPLHDFLNVRRSMFRAALRRI